MNRYNKQWTAQEMKAASKMRANGLTTEVIAGVMGRTTKAVQVKFYNMDKATPSPKLKFTQANKPREATYTRYLEPKKKEVSILWGMIKYTR
jgi:predicted extracellular nuclease